MSAPPDLRTIRRRVELAGRISDSLVRLGPFSVGLDGVLDWIPGLGEAYSLAAGAFILIHGLRARVPLHILALAGALMLGRTVITAVPVAGPLAADFLTTHRFAARLICAAIDRQLAGEAPRAESARLPIWRRRGPPLAA